jgi:CRP-like cAMP-binding protein
MFRNHVLNSLNSADLAALTSSLQEVALGAGQLLCDAGDLPDSVYFPSNCVISTVTLLRDGRAFEVSSAGYEGVANLFPILTGIPPQTRTFVQIPGTAFRLPAPVLRAHLDLNPSMMKHVLAYLQINHAQAERTIACNAVHPLPARLARWLLISNDRVDIPVMALTQDYMCVMAGALRSSISLTASGFKRDGLVTYSRGQIKILDRPGLEKRACECYQSDQDDLVRLLAVT